MSYTDRVLKSMSFGQIYDQATLSAITRIPEKDVGQVLHMLAQGGVVELLQQDRYRKNRKYTTRQMQIF